MILDVKKLKALVYRLSKDTGTPAHTIRESCAKGLGFRDWQSARPQLSGKPESTPQTPAQHSIFKKPLLHYSDKELKNTIEALLGDPRKAFEVFVPALRACSHLVSDINNTGGITLEEGTNNEVPVADANWLDLAITARYAEAALQKLGLNETLHDPEVQTGEFKEDVFGDLCDTCMTSGVQIARTDEHGKTVCIDCDEDSQT